ncbi:major facilitator superfamily domain-containing protein [Lineolata rhizophorae]|uniref:Major facilitator superfamily domain-containing protein n=1 Tax=Lineolata rhizophorae TaxID=578093 RepID=A0A6A6P977_9PEZI|nr:major facilitator superfamily domain-containing protein [Lineolata rhizophorae]
MWAAGPRPGDLLRARLSPAWRPGLAIGDLPHGGPMGHYRPSPLSPTHWQAGPTGVSPATCLYQSPHLMSCRRGLATGFSIYCPWEEPSWADLFCLSCSFSCILACTDSETRYLLPCCGVASPWYRAPKRAPSAQNTSTAMSSSPTGSKVEVVAEKEDISKDLESAYAESQAGSPEYQARTKALLWKQDIRIIPLSCFIYLLCYLDRSNIGNAKVLNEPTNDDLLQDTNMTNYQFTIALMVFLVAYGTFEVPSNYMLKKFRPSNWVAFLMFAWGAITMGLGGTQSYGSVTAVRFLLGTFEAGLFPGLVYYLTFWYKTEERSIRVALILASATLAGAFGGALAYAIGHMNGTQGLSGWRWLFILEGLPSCLSSIFVFFLLPDYPETAKWLSIEEKEFATGRLELEGSKGHAKVTWADAKATLMDWRLYAHYAIYFGISTPFSSLSLFTPSITSGLGFEDLKAQLMTVPPYAVAYVVTLFASWSADHFNKRALHSAIFASIGAIGFLASAVLPPDAYQRRFGCLIVAASGAFACIPPLLGWLSSNLHSTGSVGLAIAINVSVGAPGQIAGVWIYKADEKARGYPTGHWTNCALLFFVAAGCLGLWRYYARRNARARAEGTGAREFRY